MTNPFNKPALKPSTISPALQTRLEEAKSEQETIQVVITTETGKRNPAIEFFAANHIKVITEVTPIFIIEAPKEIVLLLQKETSFIKLMDMTSTYKLSKGIK